MSGRLFSMCALVALIACTKPAQNTATEGGADAGTIAKADSVCGDLPCETFDSADQAFDRVLTENPRVLAIGETHAQGDAKVESTTKRFTEHLLPRLAGKSKNLVLELWVANGSCGKAEKKVAAQQKDVTATQAPTDQNEFITLGNAAKSAGIQPHVLVPPCDDYAKILEAGAGDIDAMLTMIASLSKREILALAEKHDGIVVAYGGAMHNDAKPRPGMEMWSYGPDVSRAVAGSYVELDLIVPEFIKDTDSWKSQPWYPSFRRDLQGKKAVLMTVSPGSYALFFPPG